MVGIPHPYGCQCVDCLPRVRYGEGTDCRSWPVRYITARAEQPSSETLKELADLKREVQRLRTENFQLRNRQRAGCAAEGRP